MPARVEPKIITSGAEMRRLVVEAQRAGKRVGVVPTMGALHEGHLNLVDAARPECGVVVTTIFVNPTQFGPHEDFAKYPRDLNRDTALLATRGCDYVFAPAEEEIYPAGNESSVDVGSVARPLEGAHRPNHFTGVATVVLKLLNLAPADFAYFGRKDYQQTLVVQRLVTDLHLPTKIQVCPIVREADGLAMSSRNAYLSSDERRRAAGLFASLQLGTKLAAAGERNVAVIQQAMLTFLKKLGGIEVDYVAFVRAGSLNEIKTINGPAVALLAARIGPARLIDNVEID